MLSEYSGLCGIARTELEGVLRPCVEKFAEGFGCTTEEAYAHLKRQYDGVELDENQFNIPIETARTPVPLLYHRSYAVQWAADGRRVTKCEAVLSSEARNIVRWRITSEDGTVLEDQNFE